MTDESISTEQVLAEMLAAFEASYSSLAFLKVLQSEEADPDRVLTEARALVNYILQEWDELAGPACERAEQIIDGLDQVIERAVLDSKQD